MDENENTFTTPAEEDTQDESRADKKKKKKAAGEGGVISVIYEAVSCVVSSIMLISLIFTFGFRLIGVIGPSMLATLENGDWLIVTPYYDEPEYGDIIISTKETAADGSIVKRVIAVAGDKVFIDENGGVYVNDVKLQEESYILDDGRLHGDREYPVTVPEGCVMLMGDNRAVSWDSRYTEIGFAEVDYLLGKAQLRIAETKNDKLTISDEMDIYSNFNK